MHYRSVRTNARVRYRSVRAHANSLVRRMHFPDCAEYIMLRMTVECMHLHAVDLVRMMRYLTVRMTAHARTPTAWHTAALSYRVLLSLL